MENLKNKLIKEVSENKAKMLDDFFKVYIASRWDDYFSKQTKIDFKRVELVEQINSVFERVYFFRLKRGPLPKNKK